MTRKPFYHVLVAVAIVALLVPLAGTGGATAQPPVPSIPAAPEAPMGTAFTYQGELTDGGSPANGNYDFRFRLYDAVNGGNQVGGSVAVEDASVVDGQFSVRLDFGGGIFRGEARWLEVGVRPGDSTDPYTVLEPRQALTPTPYALYAASIPSHSHPHDHLGETWTGNDNPLAITGAFGGPDDASLLLGNSHVAGHGLKVLSAGLTGVYVEHAGGDGMAVGSADGFGLRVGPVGGHGVYVQSTANDGMFVDSAGYNGLRVVSAVLDGVHVEHAGGDGMAVGSADGFGLRVGPVGGHGVYVQSAAEDGMYVGSAGYNGLRVDSAVLDGVHVEHAGGDGMYVGSADSFGLRVGSAVVDGVNVEHAGGDGMVVGSADGFGLRVGPVGGHGVYVQSAAEDGMYVGSAGYNGLRVDAAVLDGVHIGSAGGYAGYFGGDIYVGGTCYGCTLAIFGVNTSDRPLEPGDIVSIEGVRPSGLNGIPMLMEISLALNGEAPLGVVQGLVEQTSQDGSNLGETGRYFVPRGGPAPPGGYVAIVTYGAVQVKTSAVNSSIAAGTRLAVDSGGQARALRTVRVDGIEVAESVPTLGIALEPLGSDGRIWVLVNPQ